jgi:hypothetical protein
MKQINIYTFQELTPEVQTKVLNNFEPFLENWWEYTYEEAESWGLKITEFDLTGQTITIKNTIPMKGVLDRIDAPDYSWCRTLSDVGNQILKELNAQLDYLYSDECKRDYIIENDYYFTAGGVLC